MRSRTNVAWGAAVVAVSLTVAACGSDSAGSSAQSGPQRDLVRSGSLATVIPKPVSVIPTKGDFVLDGRTALVITSGAQTARDAAALLRREVEPATGYGLPARSAATGAHDQVVFTEKGAGPMLGAEGYQLHIRPGQLEVVANGSSGFIWGVQTIMQILPPAIENRARQAGTWLIPAATITDTPRFAWRGYMLDVARRFVPLSDVEHLVDLMSEYKLNRLHLHLTDDQGWRIQIPSHPELTELGATKRVGGGGGFYTDQQYRHLVEYARERGVTVVPEVDMPGHVTAALIADPFLACGGTAPPPKTGLMVSANALCTTKTSTYRFVSDVISALAAMTPGPYLHMGGDEAIGVTPDQYAEFVTRVAQIVVAHGKQPIAWDDVDSVPGKIGAIVQAWHPGVRASPALVAAPGVIVSPANRAYLDQKYNPSLTFGQSWAGYVNTETAYTWDPATAVPGLPAASVLGPEAALWSDTLTTFDQAERLTLPRLPGYAELGWSPAAGRNWAEYRVRLAAQAARWSAQGFDFYPDPAVPWSDGRSPSSATG